MNEFNPGYEGIIAALNNIQSELKVPKRQLNKTGNYNFRNCDDIIEAVKPLLKKYNVVLLMYDTIESINNNTYVKATASLVSPKGNQIKVTAYAREMPERLGIMSEPMLTGSASSYARKYALNGLFALDDSKDPDDNIEVPKAAAKEEKVPEQQGPTPRQIDIISKNICNAGVIEYLDSKGVDRVENLDRDSASELVAKIFRGDFK